LALVALDLRRVRHLPVMPVLIPYSLPSLQMVEEVAEHSVLLVQMADQEAVVLEGRGLHLLLLQAAAIPQVHPHPKETTAVQVFLTQQHGVSAVAVAVLGQQQPM
jgi:hypothetical protein